MKQNLIVSSKGQITLPAAMRRALGLQGNAIVTAEQQGGRIVLVPAMVVETEVYSDEEVRAWQREDAFAPGEREVLARKIELGRPAAASPGAKPARSKRRTA
jgi:AbrB family looped-hinge helix DNA binding protein